MIEQRTYRVGGHTFALEDPKGMLSEKELLPYAPFKTDSYFGEEPLFTLTLDDNSDSIATKGQTITNIEDENGKITLFMEDNGGLTIYLAAVSGNQCCRLLISPNYRSAKAWLGGSPSEMRYSLDTALMLLYTFSSSKHSTLLLHASTVECEGKGYLFLGKSGTGKSTHSRLWLEHIKGSELLNDDNPIVRIIDGAAYVYGSPWSGNTSCYRNRMIAVGGIVRLHQAPLNRITPIAGVKAYATLLPSCSGMKWNHEMAEAIHSTISRVIERVPIYCLECLPNQEAAHLSYKVMRSINNNE